MTLRELIAEYINETIDDDGDVTKKLHRCESTFTDSDGDLLPLIGMYGFAANVCEEHADGTLWIDNGEYSNAVNYCPFCGYKATKQVVL